MSENDEGLVTIEEAAKMFNCTVSILNKLRKRGELFIEKKARHNGSTNPVYLYVPEEVEEALETMRPKIDPEKYVTKEEMVKMLKLSTPTVMKMGVRYIRYYDGKRNLFYYSREDIETILRERAENRDVPKGYVTASEASRIVGLAKSAIQTYSDRHGVRKAHYHRKQYRKTAYCLEDLERWRDERNKQKAK